jgi:hypothetical protein
MSLDKPAVARAQLGTALALFLQDLDPVSVHTLACAGGEIAEHLARKAGKPSFSLHALETFPDLTIKELKILRNQYWNAFKHATDLKGLERDDERLFERFGDDKNEGALFVGWYDYGLAVPNLPIEAQAFLAWFLALYPEKLNPNVDPDDYQTLFPNLRAMDGAARKEALRAAIASARNDPEIMTDPRTDPGQLIIAA